MGAAAVPCAGDGAGAAAAGRAAARLAARGVSPGFIVVGAGRRPGWGAAGPRLAPWSLPELGLRPLAPIIFRTTIAF